MKWIAVPLVALAALAAAPAWGGLRVVLTGEAAREVIRNEGGHPHKCKRLSPRRIRCTATFWYERHEAEQEPDGSLVNETVTYYPEEEIRVIALKVA